MRANFKHTAGTNVRTAARVVVATPVGATGHAKERAPGRDNGSDVATSGGTPDLLSDDDVLDVAEAAKLLRIGRNLLYELVGRNKIPHRRLGKQIRFSRAAVMRWLAQCSLQDAKEGQ